MDYHRFYDKICLEYHEKSEKMKTWSFCSNNSVKPSEKAVFEQSVS